jgi:hypothetical protein
MSNVTELSRGQINGRDTITIELIEADETPAVIIIRWPAKATVLHPRRFPAAADTTARVFAAAVVKLAQIRRDQALNGQTGAKSALLALSSGSARLD